MLFQQVALGEGGKKCWGILQIFPYLTLTMTSKVLVHQKSTFNVAKWLPKPHSMFPPMWDPKVIIVGTLKHTFLELLQLKFCLKYFRKYSPKITLT